MPAEIVGHAPFLPLPQLAHGLVLGEAVHILPMHQFFFFGFFVNPYMCTQTKQGLPVSASISLSINQIIASRRFRQLYNLYTCYVNFDFLQMHVLYDCPRSTTVNERGYSHFVNSHFVCNSHHIFLKCTSSVPTLSTSHFVNSHFVNSRFVNIDQMGIDKMGIDKVGS